MIAKNLLACGYALPILFFLGVLSYATDTPNAFLAFDNWMTGYLQTDVTQRATMLENGIGLAKQRRASLAELIRTDPARALSTALTRVQLEELPPEIARYTERYVSGLASTSPFNAGRDDLDQDHRRDLIMQGEVFRGWVYGRRLKMLRFLEVPIWGIAVGTDLAVAESPFEVFSGETAQKLFKEHIQKGRKLVRIGGEDREFGDQEKIDAALARIHGDEDAESENQQQKWKDRPASGRTNLVFRFDLADLKVEKRDGYDLVSLKDCVLPEDKPGVPWLPAKFLNVLIPAGARVKDVRVTTVEELAKEGVVPFPVQPPVSGPQVSVAFVPPDQNVYTKNDIFPKQSGIQVSDSQRLSGWTFVSVRLNPLRCLPAEKKLLLAKEIGLTVSYKIPKAPLPVPEKHLKHGEETVGRIVVNQSKDDLVAPEPVTRGERDAARKKHLDMVDALSKPVSRKD